MDALQFVAHLVGALAWPTVVVVLVVMLREPLLALLPVVQRLKYKDLELEFSEQVEEVEEALEQELPAVEPGRAAGAAQAELRKLAEISPSAAVVQAWFSVEDAAIGLARRLGRDTVWSAQAFRFLEKSGHLSPRILESLKVLRRIRNQAAHVQAPGNAFSREVAVQFAEISERYARYLASLTDAPRAAEVG